MKKIIILLFIFCPILGFFRTTFFSQENECRLNFSKSSSHFQILAYQGEGLSKALTMNSCVIYKTAGLSNPMILEWNQEGFIEKKPINTNLCLIDKVTVLDLKGQQADKAIAMIDGIVKKYPFISYETAFIGPNSNTLSGYILRKLDVDQDMPSNCAGKDYLGSGIKWIYQPAQNLLIASVSGYVTLCLSKEKFEFQILGLTLGYNWELQKLLLPGFGDLDISDLILLIKSKT